MGFRIVIGERRFHIRGFSLIELLVVLAIISVLITLVSPRYMGSLDKAKEAALKQNLQTLRSAVDNYYSDRGVYPESLQVLVDEKYLRNLPEDPITGEAKAWVIMPPPLGQNGKVYDVHSSAKGKGKNGLDYAEW